MRIKYCVFYCNIIVAGACLFKYLLYPSPQLIAVAVLNIGSAVLNYKYVLKDL